ncbi:DUF5683 domain-containing protein [Sphingobacterium griseoflavum]|uniref:DUF5683 domain-containing protein n=1 Tax=Sphingobacterium griseoflavum TaxID=1474952 RepID=A0ABQ3HVG4_9SPHI|nr:DUF5683 domain-containing protein [Sphingobacterium griseoflavum]GHE38757.1 hypothetical protein GCM10017764_22390 [Sphingobacterium griseoflavum]
MRYIVTALFLFFSFFVVQAQQDSTKAATLKEKLQTADSIATAQDTTKKDTTKKEETRKERRERERAQKERDKYYYKGIKKDSARLAIEHVSRVAWKRSLMVPGWGQYTNGGLWWVKVPIIYGGLVTGYLVFDYWQWYYKKFLDELAFRVETNGQEGSRDPDLQFYSTQGLVTQKDYARRNRDLTILITVGFWGLNAIEAYVDSMLKNRWNIGSAITMKVGPTFVPSYGFSGNSVLGGYGMAPGIKLTMNIK